LRYRGIYTLFSIFGSTKSEIQIEEEGRIKEQVETESMIRGNALPCHHVRDKSRGRFKGMDFDFEKKEAQLRKVILGG